MSRAGCSKSCHIPVNQSIHFLIPHVRNFYILIQVQACHVSEIDSLLVYPVLDHFYRQIKSP